jgi:hypothetical protein
MNRIHAWLVLFLFLAAAILTIGCAPLSEQGPKGEFLMVCKAKAREHGGKISKEEFIAEAKNKAQAEQVFEVCDVKKRGYLTEEELSEPQKRRMIQEVIRLTEPPR